MCPGPSRQIRDTSVGEDLMPWKPSQQRAIAAQLSRDGKSEEQIRRFFHAHGHKGHSYGAKRKLKKRS